MLLIVLGHVPIVQTEVEDIILDGVSASADVPSASSMVTIHLVIRVGTSLSTSPAVVSTAVVVSVVGATARPLVVVPAVA